MGAGGGSKQTREFNTGALPLLGAGPAKTDLIGQADVSDNNRMKGITWEQAIAGLLEDASVAANSSPSGTDRFPLESGGTLKYGTWTQITAAGGVIKTSQQTPMGRLSLVTGNSFNANPGLHPRVIDATTLYYVLIGPVYMYESSVWVAKTSTAGGQVSIATSGLSIDTFYDVFLYDNAGTLTLVFVAWSYKGKRATALTNQDGVWLKSGDTAKRYVGSVFCTTTAAKLSSMGPLHREIMSVQDMIDPDNEYSWYGPWAGWTLPWNLCPFVGCNPSVTPQMLLPGRRATTNAQVYPSCAIWVHDAPKRVIWYDCFDSGSSVATHNAGPLGQVMRPLSAETAESHVSAGASSLDTNSWQRTYKHIFAPTVKKVWIVEGGATVIAVISTLTGTIVRTAITGTGVSATATGGCWCPSTDRILLNGSEWNPNTNARTNALARAYQDIIYCPVNDRCYGVAISGAVYCINPSTLAESATITPSAGTSYVKLIYVASTKRIWAVDSGSSGIISIIDPSSNTEEVNFKGNASSGSGEYPCLGWHPLRNKVYLAGGNNAQVYAFDVTQQNANSAGNTEAARLELFCFTTSLGNVFPSSSTRVSIGSPQFIPIMGGLLFSWYDNSSGGHGLFPVI